MSETKPTEEAGAPLAQEAAEKAVQLSEAGGELRVEIRNTFSEVISDKTLVQIWGKDGKLSEGRAGFAAAVVAMMQDRLLQQLDEHRRAQLSMAGQLLLIFKKPMFASPFKEEKPAKAGEEEKREKKGLIDYITWQNFIAGGAVVLVALAALVTGMTKNYRSQYEETRLDLKEVQVELQQAQQIIVSLTGEKSRAEADAANYKKQVELAAGSAEGQQEEVKRLIAENGDLKAENTRLAASAGFAKRWDELLQAETKRKDEALRESERQRARAERAEKKVTELTESLAKAKTTPPPQVQQSPTPAPPVQ